MREVEQGDEDPSRRWCYFARKSESGDGADHTTVCDLGHVKRRWHLIGAENTGYVLIEVMLKILIDDETFLIDVVRN